MSRACVLCHQCSSAAVLVCTRPTSCVSRFAVSKTADTLGWALQSPTITASPAVTYMRPRPICLEGPGAASIPRRQVMVATQPPPRDVSSIPDIDDVIPPSQMSCCSKSHMVLATQPNLKTFLLKSPRYHGRVHLSWCISDVASIADVDDILSPWRGSSSGGRQTLTSRWLFYSWCWRCHCPLPDVMEGYIPGSIPADVVDTTPTPHPHPVYFPVPDAMEGHVAYVSNITQYIGCTLPYPYPDDVLLLTGIGTGTEFYILCRSAQPYQH